LLVVHRHQLVLQQEVLDALPEVAIARGDRETARAQLEAIDARFGGLAAPRIVELADRLTPPR